MATEPEWFAPNMRKQMAPTLRSATTLKALRSAIFDADGKDVRNATPGVDWSILKDKKEQIKEEVREAIQEAFDKFYERITGEKSQRSSLDTHFLPIVKTPAAPRTKTRLAKANARASITAMCCDTEHTEKKTRLAKANASASITAMSCDTEHAGQTEKKTRLAKANARTSITAMSCDTASTSASNAPMSLDTEHAVVVEKKTRLAKANARASITAMSCDTASTSASNVPMSLDTEHAVVAEKKTRLAKANARASITAMSCDTASTSASNAPMSLDTEHAVVAEKKTRLAKANARASITAMSCDTASTSASNVPMSLDTEHAVVAEKKTRLAKANARASITAMSCDTASAGVSNAAMSLDTEHAVVPEKKMRLAKANARASITAMCCDTEHAGLSEKKSSAIAVSRPVPVPSPPTKRVTRARAQIPTVKSAALAVPRTGPHRSVRSKTRKIQPVTRLESPKVSEHTLQAVSLLSSYPCPELPATNKSSSTPSLASKSTSTPSPTNKACSDNGNSSSGETPPCVELPSTSKSSLIPSPVNKACSDEGISSSAETTDCTSSNDTDDSQPQPSRQSSRAKRNLPLKLKKPRNTRKGSLRNVSDNASPKCLAEEATVSEATLPPLDIVREVASKREQSPTRKTSLDSGLVSADSNSNVADSTVPGDGTTTEISLVKEPPQVQRMSVANLQVRRVSVANPQVPRVGVASPDCQPLSDTIVHSPTAPLVAGTPSAESLYESCVSELDLSPCKPPSRAAKTRRAKKTRKPPTRIPTPYSTPDHVPAAETSPEGKNPTNSSSTFAPAQFLSPVSVPYLMGTPKTLRQLQDEHAQKRSGGGGRTPLSPFNRQLGGNSRVATPLWLGTEPIKPSPCISTVVKTGRSKRLRSVSLERLSECVLPKRQSLAQSSEEEGGEGSETADGGSSASPDTESEATSSGENTSDKPATSSSQKKTNLSIVMGLFSKKANALPNLPVSSGVAVSSFLPRNSPRKPTTFQSRQQKLTERVHRKAEEEDKRQRELETKKQQQLQEKIRLREERVKRVAEKQATLEEEKKRKVQDRVREQPRALQVKRARELEIKEKNKKHKERMVAVEARRHREEEMRMQRREAIEEERRMAEELVKRRLEQEEEDKRLKRADKQRHDRERHQQQLLKETTERERETELKRKKLEEQQQQAEQARHAQELARKQDQEREEERRKFNADRKKFEKQQAEQAKRSQELARKQDQDREEERRKFNADRKKFEQLLAGAMASKPAPVPLSVIPRLNGLASAAAHPRGKQRTLASVSPPGGHSIDEVITRTVTKAKPVLAFQKTPNKTTSLNKTFTKDDELPTVPSSSSQPSTAVTSVANPTVNLPSKYTIASSYEMTPVSRDPLAAAYECYGIDDLSSGDSTDDDDNPKKQVPLWVHPSVLNKCIVAQEAALSNHAIDLKKIFPPEDLLKTPDLAKMFARKRKRFFTRSSSAHWNSPMIKKTKAG